MTAYEQGYFDYFDGINKNPFQVFTEDWENWKSGWKEAAGNSGYDAEDLAYDLL